MKPITALSSLLLVGMVAGCAAGSDSTDIALEDASTAETIAVVLDTTTTALPTTTAQGAAATAEEVTAFLDQWVADWNDGNLEDLFGVFLPEGVFVEADGKKLVGGEIAVDLRFGPLVSSMERTGDAVDNGDGSYSFKVEWTTEKPKTNKRVLAITMHGDKLIKMVETRDN
jgi:hypothetical protein